ncbi:hypothetical protein [Streptomyces sp. G45]|uniref:hypothetical protein n=1 Tax=Streptomyces sp. G45 TaxID=3406627 RepID=UPI003C227DD3
MKKSPTAAGQPPGEGVLAPSCLASVVHCIAGDLNGRGYPVTWVVDRQLLVGGLPLQVVAKVSVVRVLNIAFSGGRGERGGPGERDEGGERDEQGERVVWREHCERAVSWRVTMGRPSSVRWEQSALLDLGADGLDGERVVRAALRALGLPQQRAVYH